MVERGGRGPDQVRGPQERMGEKKGIVRKLMKAINSASGRAAGGDFPSKIGTSLDVPLSIASSRAPSFYKKRKVNCSLVLGRNMRVRLS